jgi:hypothetical protein
VQNKKYTTNFKNSIYTVRLIIWKLIKIKEPHFFTNYPRSLKDFGVENCRRSFVSELLYYYKQKPRSSHLRRLSLRWHHPACPVGRSHNVPTEHWSAWMWPFLSVHFTSTCEQPSRLPQCSSINVLSLGYQQENYKRQRSLTCQSNGYSGSYL